MSKGNGWVPLDKTLIRLLAKLNRPYSTIEAMLSFTVDVDCGNPWTIKGYAKLWQWSRNKVRKLVNECRTQEGHKADTRGTQEGHPIHFIDKGLWGEEDTKRTGKGHIEDTKPTPTKDPNPKPKETTKKRKVFIKPTIQEVSTYCQERKNTIDPEQWHDHYTSNGWMVGKNKMKDWKASVRTWERNKLKGNIKQLSGREKRLSDRDTMLDMVENLEDAETDNSPKMLNQA